MKKLIALILAAVMVFAVIGTVGAVEFTDAGEITQKNTEAVTVLSEMGIIGGMGDGTFQPNGTLTRAQAAKILAYMLLGKEGAEALPADKAAFDDVPTSHWSCKYVNYCAEQGIVSGVGNNKFNPNGQLTGFQFGKMVLVAAGFNAEQEGLTGSSWDKNVNKLIKSEMLNRGVAVTSKEISRQDACHLALNALFYGEEDDPFNTLAYKTFTASRASGGLDKEDLHRPLMLYTTEQGDVCWAGTDLTVKASPFVIYDAGFTCDQAYKDFGNKEVDIEHLDGWRNNVHFSPATFQTLPASGSTTQFMCSGTGVTTEWYYSGAEQNYVHIMLGWRALPITAVTEPVIAADGEVLEAGTVTVMGDNGEVSCASNDFTEADVGSYAICLGLGKTTWKSVVSLYCAKRATIVSGKLESEDKTVKVSGKTYKVVNNTMVLAQPTSPYPADYIANGGSVGDTVNLVLDEAGVCYAMYQ